MAIVEGLSSFTGDMGKIDKLISSLVPSSKLVGGAFNWLGDTIKGFASGALRIVQYAIGGLLTDAIEKVIDLIRELISGVLQSADAFQKLEIRLKRLNFNDLRDSGLEYNEAMEEAIRLTREQLEWTIKLGAKTPYDAKDVANIYTLARGYGFTADEAKGLTESVIDFTSGMGLSNVELERVIINFGQLRQQGKLNSQDLRDLARGAFVPINKVIAITAEKLGITVEKFNELKKSGKLSADSVDLFRQSFQDLVGLDFEGASQALGMVFSVASANVKGLIEDMLGMYVVAPVLMTIGSAIQDMVNAIVDSPVRWASVVESLNRIGISIMNIINGILGLAPSTDVIADGVVSGLGKIADWFEEHQDDIIAWAKDAAKWIEDILIPAVANLWDWLFGSEDKEGFLSKLATAAESAAKWVGDVLVPFIQDDLVPVLEVLGPLAEAIGDVLVTAFGGEVDKSFSDFIHDDLIPGIEKLTKWIEDNKDTLAFWATHIAKALVAVTLLAIGIGLIIGVLAEVTSAIVGFAVMGWILIAGWANDTRIVIDNWIIETRKKFDDWIIETRSAFGKWVTDTLTTILAWAGTTGLAIDTWITDTKAKFGKWVTDTISKFLAWGTMLLLDIDEIFLNLQIDIDTWMSRIAKMLLALAGRWARQVIDGMVDFAPRILDALNNAIAIIQAGLATIVIGVTYGNVGNKPANVYGGGDDTGTGGGCFIAGTLVTLADGKTKPIEEIVVGDWVLSFDTKEKILVSAQVEKIFHHVSDPAPYYILINNFLGVTPEHSVFVNGAWRLAGTVDKGDAFINEAGNDVVVDTIKYRYGDTTVYNLHTDHDTHNYFADGVLVHNSQSKYASGTGGNFLKVPSGFANDSFPVWMTSGERFMVARPGESLPGRAAGSSVNSQQQIINNFNLAIHSSANTEPIIQDFGMMQGMIGDGA